MAGSLGTSKNILRFLKSLGARSISGKPVFECPASSIFPIPLSYDRREVFLPHFLGKKMANRYSNAVALHCRTTCCHITVSRIWGCRRRSALHLSKDPVARTFPALKRGRRTTSCLLEGVLVQGVVAATLSPVVLHWANWERKQKRTHINFCGNLGSKEGSQTGHLWPHRVEFMCLFLPLY